MKKMTLRQILIYEAQSLGWLDYIYKQKHKDTDVIIYRSWLEDLNDSELLEAYNRVHDAEKELD